MAENKSSVSIAVSHLSRSNSRLVSVQSLKYLNEINQMDVFPSVSFDTTSKTDKAAASLKVYEIEGDKPTASERRSPDEVVDLGRDSTL